MSVGAQLWTSADGNVSLRSGAVPLPAGTTADGGLTGLTLTGPVNQAKIVGPSDIGSCKGKNGVHGVWEVGVGLKVEWSVELTGGGVGGEEVQ